jgi:hypothetical protein
MADHLVEGLSCNGVPVALAGPSFVINLTPGHAIMVANGVWVMAMSKVLLPDAK